MVSAVGSRVVALLSPGKVMPPVAVWATVLLMVEGTVLVTTSPSALLATVGVTVNWVEAPASAPDEAAGACTAQAASTSTIAKRLTGSHKST
jgi:hypothetical protein